jgi:hypothetical protein
MTDPLKTRVFTMYSQTMDRWSLAIPSENKSMITLYHGTKSYQIDLTKIMPKRENTITLTPGICQNLLLPKHLNKYNVRQLNSKHYILGPLIGIFVSETKLRKLLAGKVDPVYRLYAQVLRKNKGLAVFFSPERIDWNKDKVEGVVRVTVDQQEIWTDESLPIPSVIYDRCFGRKNRRQSKILREKCATHSPTVKVLNAVTKLGKQQIYTLCSQIPRLQKNLPRWDILRPDNIDTLLEQFPIAYIKPDKLAKGKGVTKVSRISSGFLVEQHRKNKNYRQMCSSTAQVLQELEPYISDYGFMIVQDAITLMKFRGRPFDFRLLLQKDISGCWKKTGIAGRISGKGSVISSPRSGGSVLTYDKVMTDLSKTKRSKIAASMLNLALDLAETMDNLIGPFVELGFDLGVDIKGQVKIIEINGIPLKVSIERLKDRKISRAAHVNPIRYAIYMSGFGDMHYE